MSNTQINNYGRIMEGQTCIVVHRLASNRVCFAPVGSLLKQSQVLYESLTFVDPVLLLCGKKRPQHLYKTDRD